MSQPSFALVSTFFFYHKVYESLVINEYLCEAFPPGGEYDAPPLLPKSLAGRAKARIITSRCGDLVTAYFTYLSNNDEVRSSWGVCPLRWAHSFPAQSVGVLTNGQGK